MSIQTESGPQKSFVRCVLPWLIAAAALLLYLVTVNHWISISNIQFVARATGQMWTPELAGGAGGFGPYPPLLWLVTYPLRWLPQKWIPLALNLFSAFCGAATLGWLARSVALLPHDRTHEQRQREHSDFAFLSTATAWIPPVLAVVVCGLQLSFWENATVASDEAFQVMLFAYVIRCLLEFRIDQRDSWIYRAALVYAASMTGNWIMIGLFPAFLASLVWIRGGNFFNISFLWRFAVCCLAGLLLLLLLPLIHIFQGHGDINLWQALKMNLTIQKDLLFFYVLKMPRNLQLLLATTSLLPILLLSIRWASYFGDPSKVGIAITTGILHMAHAALLAACVWVAFDPVFSPRYKGIFLPHLSYLGALSVGYFIGYFLLVFKPLPTRMPRPQGWRIALNRLSLGTTWALLILVPAGLFAKNLPQIRMTNGPAMEKFASLMTKELPASGLVLCDSQTRGDTPLKLWLVQAWLARQNKTSNYMLVDTMALQIPYYHGILQRRYGRNWPKVINPRMPPQKLPDIFLLRLVAQMSQQMPVYYLNPTFGYYIEAFYQRPHGAIFEMTQYPTNAVSRPPVTLKEIDENESFWKSNWPDIQPLEAGIQPANRSGRTHSFQEWWMKRLRIPFEPNLTAVILGRFYSQSLDFWAVQLQRSGRWGEAAHFFDLALAMNPQNIAAISGAECNGDLRAGRAMTVPKLPQIQEEFGKYRDWVQVIRDNGLFDDPEHCLIQGLTFTQGRLFREAAQQFERIHQLVPDYLPACLWLARFYARNSPEKSLGLLDEIRDRPAAAEDFGIRKQDVRMTEAMAYFASKRTAEGEEALQQAMDMSPKDENLLSMVVQISAMFGRFTNALTAVDRELQIAPTNSAALLIQGYLQMQNGNFDLAIPPLTRALALEANNHTARFDRAIAYLRNNQLNEAQNDYKILEKVFPTSFRVYYGLGEIAWQKKETNAAVHYYKLYLANSTAGTDEAKIVSSRLQSLTGTPP